MFMWPLHQLGGVELAQSVKVTVLSLLASDLLESQAASSGHRDFTSVAKALSVSSQMHKYTTVLASMIRHTESYCKPGSLSTTRPACCCIPP